MVSWEFSSRNCINLLVAVVIHPTFDLEDIISKPQPMKEDPKHFMPDMVKDFTHPDSSRTTAMFDKSGNLLYLHILGAIQERGLVKVLLASRPSVAEKSHSRSPIKKP
jgi:hypothetical protein